MLDFRCASAKDIVLYFKWANDEQVRQNSLNTNAIDFQDHIEWFTSKIDNPNVYMYVFIDENKTPVGQVIIEKKEGWVAVGQSVAVEQRGKKYGTEMLTKSTNDFLRKFPEETIISVVKGSNVPSIKMAKNSGFNVLILENEQGINLVLKGCKQNDEAYIEQAKSIFNL